MAWNSFSGAQCQSPTRSSFGVSKRSNSLASFRLYLFLLLFRIFFLSIYSGREHGGIGKKPDLQKSSWTGFVWFYRVSLRFIEFYRATFLFFVPPWPLFHSSRFLAPRRRDRRFAVVRERNKSEKRKRKMEQKINHDDAVVTNH